MSDDLSDWGIDKSDETEPAQAQRRLKTPKVEEEVKEPVTMSDEQELAKAAVDGVKAMQKDIADREARLRKISKAILEKHQKTTKDAQREAENALMISFIIGEVTGVGGSLSIKQGVRLGTSVLMIDNKSIVAIRTHDNPLIPTFLLSSRFAAWYGGFLKSQLNIFMKAFVTISDVAISEYNTVW